MRRKILAALFALFAGMLAFAAPAGASGDYGCDPYWRLATPDLDCASSIVMSPGNDTRVNLALLARDRAGLASKPGDYPELDWDRSYARNFFDWQLFAKASYPWEPAPDNDYYGSRCVSLKGGDAAFAAAVNANRKVPAEERSALIAARDQLAPICESFGASYWLRDDQPSAPPSSWPASVESKPGREFLAYLVAAAAFYGEDWDAARSGFAALTSASDKWVRETARYMAARVEINAAQATAFDDWGFFEGPEKVDRQAALHAGQALDAYLAAYPQGNYAASAKGLERRVMWLGGDLSALADLYEHMLAEAVPGSQYESELIEEIDNKLFLTEGAEKAIDTPLLLATYDLMRMRRAGELSLYDYGQPPIDKAELEAQAPIFADHPKLYDFLRATYAYYIDQDVPEVLDLIPDNSHASSHSALDFSAQVLRGMALAGSDSPEAEEQHWKALIAGSEGLYQRPTAELGLALNWELYGKVGQVFAPDSPIEDSMIRKILLERIAGPDILRAQAQNDVRPRPERDLALFTLLYKQLSRGFYSGFGADSALISAGAETDSGLWALTWQDEIPLGLFTAGRFSDGYACPALSETAARLARDPNDVKGRLCLGDFYRLNGFDDFYEYTVPEEPGLLGTTPSQFPGEQIPRSAFYASIMRDSKAARGDRAYALYRAIRCYAPAGGNTCGGEEVPEAQRKEWFQTLKRQYAETRWAKDLEYYW